MKRTFWKTVWREITGSAGRFWSIFAIVALGAGFLAGLLVTAPDMRLSVDVYYDEAQMMDIRLLSTLGLTDADVTAVKTLDGVAAVMPAYSADALMSDGERADVVTRIHSLPPENAVWLNRVRVTAGRLPEAADECVVARQPFGEPPTLGATVYAAETDVKPADTLAHTAFTVVGIVDSPWYFSVEKESSTIGSGTVNQVLYVPQEAFCAPAYSALYVQVVGAAEQNAFSAAYADTVEAVQKRLEAIGGTLTARRYDEVTGDARQELADAQQIYDEQKAQAQQKLTDGAQALVSARRQLAEGAAALAAGRQELADRRQQLTDAQQAWTAGSQTLEDNRAALAEQRAQTEEQLTAQEMELAVHAQELAAAQQLLAAGETALSEAAAQIAEMERALAALVAAGAGESEQAQTLAAALSAAQATYEEQQAACTAQKTALAEAAARLAAGQEQVAAARQAATQQFDAAGESLAAAEAALTATEVELTAGQEQLAAGEAQLAQRAQELADGQATLTRSEADYAAAKQEAQDQLADGAAQLAQAEEELAAVEPPTLYVHNRTDSIVAYAGFDANCEKVSAIAVVFPAFFALVAVLVALTTMTRMVEEQRVQIGTLRALGYGKGAVALNYLLYAGAGTLSGAAAGLALGMLLFPRAIYGAYHIMYTLPPLQTPFRWSYALTIGAAALLCIWLTTLAACGNALRERPARLLMPKSPKAGKRVFLERLPLWRHLSFLHKVTARNLFRYKKRFFMTVIGVAGCTALLLTGFGLHDSIAGIVEKQYGELWHYDLMAVMKTEESLQDEAVAALAADERVESALPVSQQTADLACGEKTQTAYLYVPQRTDGLEEFLTLRERKSGRALTLGDTEALLTEKAAAELGVSPGDTVEVTLPDRAPVTVTVGGVAENYMSSYLYLSPALYRQTFGEEPSCRVLLLRERDGEAGLTADLLATGEAASVMAVAQLRTNFSDALGSMDSIVMVLILCAGLLAFVVLYNLTTINITERQRELATLKVLGFYDGETAAYVYRENGVLTVIGLLAGLVGGIFLHRFVVRTAEVEMVMFERVIRPLSYLWASLLTLAFAALVDVVMLRRLKHIDMVESMKSGE